MNVDPFTFEIIRHKLMRIVDEAVITLKHISGSSTTTEGHDLLVGLYRADGSLLMAVMGYLHALPGAGEACRHIMREYSDNPGIQDGDVFMVNDPYVAALHSSDAYVVSPIFYRDKLVAWSANFVHLRDIGAINPGGFAPNSREIYHEGIMCPGIKIVEQGKIRKDVWNTLLNMVRVPDTVALDLKSQIAANTTVKERFNELFDKYGQETVDIVSQGLIDESESLLRKRLTELPNGTWKTRHYIEAEEVIYTVHLAMTKKKDAVHFDFTGTSPQAPVPFNSAYWGSYGGILAPLFPLLGYDILWNDGMMKPVTMNAPEGSLVNCTRPAPNCLATLTGIGLINAVALESISKMLVASDNYRKEATCVWQGAQTPTTVSGYKNDRLVVSTISQNLGGCGGARTFADGVDYAGCIPTPVNRTPNIEFEELNLPILYAFHHLQTDSAGPGRFRGGMTAEYGITAHGAKDDKVNLVLYCTGTEFTRCLGFNGGLPGNNTDFGLVQNENVYENLKNDGFPRGEKSLNGERVPVSWGTYELESGDLLHGCFGGGGGYGDPLERDPQRVCLDVINGLVSRKWADRSYGTILTDDLQVDQKATERRRGEIREARLEAAKFNGEILSIQFPEDAPVYNLSEELRAIRGGNGKTYIQCTKSGFVLCPIDQNWKDHCALSRAPLSDAGPRRSNSGRFEMRLFMCPKTAQLLDVEVALPDDPPLYDEIQIKL